MRFHFLSALVLISCTLQAQVKPVPDAFKNMSVRSIGPAVTSGRITAIDVQEGNEQIIYAGAASGGLWKSENGGIEWTPLFDEQDICAIGSVCIDPSNPDVIWAGTGEGNPRNSQTSGKGIYRSLDGGRTWKCMGLEKTTTIHRVVVDPRNSDIIYAGAHGSAWGPTPDRGVFKSTDGGTSWQKILFANDTTGCSDLVMDPQNSNKLFAAMYQHYRRPWYFTSGGKGSGLHMTLDGGKTWTRLNEKNGLPEGEMGRIGVAISNSNPKVVYALIESKKTALYKSVDGGFHWEMINDRDVNDRPFYYHELYVDPSNENHLIYLHSTVSESIDGGKSWTTLLPYYGVHPDHHAFWWSKTNPKFMIEGNDGGLNLSRDGGKTWSFANNLPLGQFYHINYDLDTPYHVYGGMQDNGSWKGSAYVWHGDGIRDEDWQEILFGDGFDVMPQADDSRYVYAEYQGGELSRVDSYTGEAQFLKPTHPDGEKLRFNWNAAMAADPTSNTGIYFGSQYLHYSPDRGSSWKIISPDLTTNDPEKQKQSTTGGLTIDNTAAETHCTIIAIAPAKIDKDVVWVGTDDGQVQLTQDGGKTWKNVTPNIAGFPKNGWVPQIVASNTKSGAAWVVVNNYRQNDWKPYLFFTSDFGKTWKNMVNEKQVSGHCLSVVQDDQEPNLVFLGTEHGLFVSFDAGTNWMKWTHHYPSVPTQDLKIHPIEGDLIIGTFGRAAWIMDDISPLRAYAKGGDAFLKSHLKALPTPIAYQNYYIQPKGQRFPADGKYAGENRQTGARLNFYFQPEEEKKEEPKKEANKATKKEESKGKKEEVKVEAAAPKKDEKPQAPKDTKVKVQIFSMQGDTLRTYKAEPDTGMNYVTWYYDTKGPRFPTRREREEDEEPGTGAPVGPGTYKVVYSFNEWKDSTTVEVRNDPRVPKSKNVHDKQTEMRVRINQSVALLNDAWTQIREARKTMELVSTNLKNAPDSVKKDYNALSDSLTKRFDSIEKLIWMPEDAKGIQDDSHLLMTAIYIAYAKIESGSVMPGQDAEYAIALAEKRVRDLADKTNAIFDTEWEAWKKAAEKIQWSPYKERKRL